MYYNNNGERNKNKNIKERNKVNKMYICCNIYTHPKRKPKQFIYKNHSMRIDTDMRMRQEGYKLTQRIIIDPSQKNYKKALKYR